MVKKMSTEPKNDAAFYQNQRESFILTHGTSTVASYGPVEPDWDGKPTTLRAVIEEWIKPIPDRVDVLVGDAVVWHEDKLVAVMREFAPNRFEVLVFDYALLDEERPRYAKEQE